jgi:hypothetical protein
MGCLGVPFLIIVVNGSHHRRKHRKKNCLQALAVTLDMPILPKSDYRIFISEKTPSCTVNQPNVSRRAVFLIIGVI